MKKNMLWLTTALSLALLASCSSTETESATGSATSKDTDSSVTLGEGNTNTPDELPNTPATPPEGDMAVDSDMSLDTTPDMGVDTENPEAVDPYAEDFEISPQSQTYGDAIIASRSEEENMAIPLLLSPQDPIAEFILPLLGLTPEDTDDFAIAVSAMNVKAYGIAVIKPVEGAEETVLTGLQGFIDTQIQGFTNYLADQLDVAENAKLETLEDGTILLVMCEDQDTTYNAIVENLS